MVEVYGNYLVYSSGKVFSLKRNIFMRFDKTKDGYLQVTLSNPDGVERIKVHRLIAMLFCKNDNPLLNTTVNHIDGNKENNDYRNLEWCTQAYNNYHARTTGLNDISYSNSKRWLDPDFRKRVSKNISIGLIKHKTSLGKNNPMYRYKVLINGKEYSRQELINMFKDEISTSRLDVIIKLCAMGKMPKFCLKHNMTVIDTKES